MHVTGVRPNLVELISELNNEVFVFNERKEKQRKT